MKMNNIIEVMLRMKEKNEDEIFQSDSSIKPYTPGFADIFIKELTRIFLED
jgi:hypothetical protein